MWPVAAGEPHICEGAGLTIPRRDDTGSSVHPGARLLARLWRGDPGVATFVLIVAAAGSAPACSRNDPSPSPTASATRPAPTPELDTQPMHEKAPEAAKPAASVAASDEQVPIEKGAQSTCAKICNRSRDLKCQHADRCLTNCLGMASLTPCSPSISAFFACLVKEPSSHWECDDDGVAAIREGFCDATQAAALACMEAKMHG